MTWATERPILPWRDSPNTMTDAERTVLIAAKQIIAY